MKTIFDNQSYAEICERIGQLQPNAQKHWGKMTVEQMLSHCSLPMEVATGKVPAPVKDGNFIIRLFKPILYNDKPFSKNSPTAKAFKAPAAEEFNKEKSRLLSILETAHRIGEKGNWQPHPTFGKLTPEQQGKHIYKHLDHHLTQFGV